MGAEKLREHLHTLIDRTDEKFLRMMAALGEVYEEKDIFGYSINGEPKKVKEMKAIYDTQVRLAREEGECVTLAQVKNR